jgi:hypothetical protein
MAKGTCGKYLEPVLRNNVGGMRHIVNRRGGLENH